MNHLRQRQASVSAVWIANTLEEHLPNQLFSINGERPRTLSAGLIAGRVVAVTHGQSYSADFDAASGVEVEMNSPDALWRIFEVTIRVDQDFTGATEVDADQDVTVGMSVDAALDVAAVIEGFSSMDEVLVCLDEQGSFVFNPLLYSVCRSGGLFGRVLESGTLSFSALGVEENSFLEGVSTLSELEREANVSKLPIAVEFVDGVPVRRDAKDVRP